MYAEIIQELYRMQSLHLSKLEQNVGNDHLDLMYSEDKTIKNKQNESKVSIFKKKVTGYKYFFNKYHN